MDAGTFLIDYLIVDFGYRYSFRCDFRGQELEMQADAVIEDIHETILGRSGCFTPSARWC